MPKLDNGKNWYILDLDNYTNEFLVEIIIDLNKKIIESDSVKEKKEKYAKDIIEWISISMILMGIILLFVSIWLSGWMILRFLFTGILLLVWGYSIKQYGE